MIYKLFLVLVFLIGTFTNQLFAQGIGKCDCGVPPQNTCGGSCGGTGGGDGCSGALLDCPAGTIPNPSVVISAGCHPRYPGYCYVGNQYYSAGWCDYFIGEGGDTDGIYYAQIRCDPIAPPTCTSAGPGGNPTINSSLTSYDVFAYGVQNETNVLFPTWSEVGGQDDLVWYPGTEITPGTWRATVPFSSHPDLGQFRTHVYMVGSSMIMCGAADFVRNSTPTFSSLTIKNSSGTGVAFDTGNRNHICKSSFTDDPLPKSVTFEFTLTDGDGGNTIQSARMLWNGVATNLTLGSVSGNTVIARATIDYTGINNVNSFPIQVEINDTYLNTGWISTGYTWKVWNCNVPVSSSVFDGSAGQACNTTGFTLPADEKMGYTGLIYKNMSGGSDESDTLDWADSYLPLVNGGDVANPDGDLKAAARFTRLIDTGVGTTVCPSGSQFNTSTTVSAYSTNPSLKVDLSYIRDQENWFQGKGLDIRAKNDITSGVPVMANTTLSVDNLSIGTSNNGIVSSLTYKNTNGWNETTQYGFPNNWYVNKSVNDNHKYDYQTLYNDYFAKLGEGTTGVTNVSTGDTGILFVNGDLNINSDVVVPANRYLMVVSSGVINIGSSVTQVDGIYVANGGINALGTSDSQLKINGVLYGANGSNIRLARSFNQKDLNNTTPSVVVSYRPDMIFALPGKLNKILSGWREN